MYLRISLKPETTSRGMARPVSTRSIWAAQRFRKIYLGADLIWQGLTSSDFDLAAANDRPPHQPGITWDGTFISGGGPTTVATRSSPTMRAAAIMSGQDFNLARARTTIQKASRGTARTFWVVDTTRRQGLHLHRGPAATSCRRGLQPNQREHQPGRHHVGRYVFCGWWTTTERQGLHLRFGRAMSRPGFRPHRSGTNPQDFNLAGMRERQGPPTIRRAACFVGWYVSLRVTAARRALRWDGT